ncbi:MAG TPA: hypothetical protein VM076_06810 [Gemmatimonadaceae bacterium]|nr:hypothetical protein [Gemmatimonadaceae bacterium]
MRRFLVRGLFALVAPIVLVGCGRESSGPDTAAAVFDGNYFMRGTITETGHPWGYLMKATSGGSSKEPSAAFTVSSETVIRRLDGSPASKADLQPGRTISLWITGIILESLPVQVEAKSIVID